MTPAVRAAERAGIEFRLHEYSRAEYGESDYAVAVARELGGWIRRGCSRRSSRR